MECMRLHVTDIEFGNHQIVVRDRPNDRNCASAVLKFGIRDLLNFFSEDSICSAAKNIYGSG